MQTMGFGVSPGDLTTAQSHWVRIHTLLDRGYVQCPDCHRIIEPVRQKKQHLLDFGETMRGVLNGDTAEYRAGFCPHCGATVSPTSKAAEKSVPCTICSRDWPESYVYCATCGRILADDVGARLEEAANNITDADGWEQYRRVFDGFFGSSKITEEMGRRLKELSTGPNMVTSAAVLEQARSAQ